MIINWYHGDDNDNEGDGDNCGIIPGHFLSLGHISLIKLLCQNG